ncbi:MAG: PDZ domain-containing protein [Bacteroidales bacterium]
MKKRIFMFMFLFLPFFAYPQDNVLESRMMTYPAISKNQIAFSYANDLWTANLDGKNVRKLTSSEGKELNPFFSPDGKTIAFTAQYDGNTDVYTIPSEGGIPKRITWHPMSEYVTGYTPDGNSILYVSDKESYFGGDFQLYKHFLNGSLPERVKLQSATNCAYSPDGSMVAYNPLFPAWQQWKNYRGGRVSTIWICKLNDLSVEKIPQPEGRCNDYYPMWEGDKIYFLSDRNGEFNIFSYEIKSKEIKKLTNFTDFPVASASISGGNILFEQAGYLHIYNISEAKSNKLQIFVPADLSTIRQRYVKGNEYIRFPGISPSGARAVFEVRGEIITVPAEKGDPRNLTQSGGFHERSPIWSPNGEKIAYFSDESGEYELFVAAQDGKGEIKKFKPGGAGFYKNAQWSPDNQKISFIDNSYTLFYIDLKSGLIKKINTEPIHDVFESMIGNWSPDSKWITYTMTNKLNIQRVYLYSLEKNLSYPVTDGLSECSEPTFDKSGKYLYFFGSTDAGPVKQWFDLSTEDMNMKNTIYLTVLDKDSLSPLAKESDEEKIEGKKEITTTDKTKGKKEEKNKISSNDSLKLKIDIEGIANRIIPIPISAGNFMNLQAGSDGEIFFTESTVSPYKYGGPDLKLHRYSLKTRKDDVIHSGLSFYLISANKKKILYSSANSWFITDLGDKLEPGKGRLNTEAIDIKIDPLAEWKQIYNEAWRINRDFFYDPNMQGADWNAMKVKYAQFLSYLSCRDDLTRVIQGLCSELTIGHSFIFGGEEYSKAKQVKGGLLGADYLIENNRYKFKKIYGGINWTPDLRSPLTEPGINVKEGEYLLAVDAKDLKFPTDLFSMFENTAGKIVELTIGANPDYTGSRKVKVVPIEDESNLRNRYWVENNLKKVDEVSKGKVAYVYVPNTSTDGHDYFKRYFFPQADREAVIIDERNNGGGSLADYYVDILRRPYLTYFATRYGADIKVPRISIQGPKVMIVNEYAGSGGDFLPWMFRKLNMGKLVGKRTWGGLVGMLGFPVLMDGGYVTAPNLAIWNEEGWIVENEGIQPDVEIDQLPSLINQGKDPQLDKAIEMVLDELQKNPPKEIKRPAYPIRVRK